jgi:hypothetical protein
MDDPHCLAHFFFQALAFLIGDPTGAVVDSEKSSRGLVVLATQRARWRLGANDYR